MSSHDPLAPLTRRRLHVDNLSDQLEALQSSRAELGTAIDAYHAFDVERERGWIRDLEGYEREASRRIEELSAETDQINRHARNVSAGAVSMLAFWKYFRAEQVKIRVRVRRLMSELSAAQVSLHRGEEKLLQVRVDRNTAHDRLVSHARFDVDDAEMRAKVLDREIRLVTSNLADARAELGRIERTIGPHVRELERLKLERDRLNEDLEDAERFEEKLSSADSPRERRMVHMACEERFGIGQPKRLINDSKGRIRSLENNIQKIERRIRSEIQKLERVIDHILIDGNNVCYEGQTFIGFRAISALLKPLSRQYKTTVVFDASIRTLMNSDTQGIERALRQYTDVYVAPTRHAADEYLLNLADGNPDTYILSNDRFAEYHDYDVVRSGRVLRFLVADGNIISNDLDLTASF